MNQHVSSTANETANAVILLVVLAVALAWWLFHHSQWRSFRQDERARDQCSLTADCVCSACRLAVPKATALPQNKSREAPRC